jgi:hypothetical protein
VNAFETGGPGGGPGLDVQSALAGTSIGGGAVGDVGGVVAGVVLVGVVLPVGVVVAFVLGVGVGLPPFVQPARAKLTTTAKSRRDRMSAPDGVRLF